MKVTIIGYSGAGKSTLARQLGAAYGVPVLHLDAVGWAEGWELRDVEEAQAAVRGFLDDSDGWIVDGNWRRLDGGRRFIEADLVVMLDFPRWRCFWRVWRRFLAARRTVRAGMAEGCPEKFDLAFARWVLHDGRTARERARYERIVADHADKAVVLRRPREVASFLKALRPCEEGEAGS